MQVYLITNKINGTQYVGQTRNTLKHRWKSHVDASRDKTKSTYMTRAINKYGAENFTIETLHICESKEEMDFVEIFYIALLNTQETNGYNLSAGGEGGNLALAPNIIGKKFGRLTVVRQSGVDKRGKTVWSCVCDCGSTLDVPRGSLSTGNTQSCGCIKQDSRVDMVGQKFGKLTVVKLSDQRLRGKPLWECLCDCGNGRSVTRRSLKAGLTKSCGCLPTGQRRSTSTYCKHGHEMTPENTYIATTRYARSCKKCRLFQVNKTQNKNRDKINARKRARRKALRNIREGRVTS